MRDELSGLRQALLALENDKLQAQLSSSRMGQLQDQVGHLRRVLDSLALLLQVYVQLDHLRAQARDTHIDQMWEVLVAYRNSGTCLVYTHMLLYSGRQLASFLSSGTPVKKPGRPLPLSSCCPPALQLTELSARIESLARERVDAEASVSPAQEAHSRAAKEREALRQQVH